MDLQSCTIVGLPVPRSSGGETASPIFQTQTLRLSDSWEKDAPKYLGDLLHLLTIKSSRLNVPPGLRRPSQLRRRTEAIDTES
jgi:hypothetical protein